MSDIRLTIDINHPEHDDARAFADWINDQVMSHAATAGWFTVNIRLDDPELQARLEREWAKLPFSESGRA